MAETTIFSGEILLMADPSEPSISQSDQLSDLILEDGKQYKVSVSGYRNSVTSSAYVDSSNVFLGPLNIGENIITIWTDDDYSVVYVETSLMIGDKYVDAPTELVMQIDQVVPDQTSNAGVMRVISIYDDSDQSYTLDSTWQEIKDAFDAGMYVFTFGDSSTSESEIFYSTSAITSVQSGETGLGDPYYTVVDGFGEYSTSSADGYPGMGGTK